MQSKGGDTGVNLLLSLFSDKTIIVLRNSYRPYPNHSPLHRKQGSIIGASLSEPHIDEFAVDFVYIYIYYISYVVP